jgi:anaerobic ribonucleoside-triphosphate reductase activating protein
MNYATIKNYDIANGLGVRVSLFVSGCPHRCKNCFNAEAWPFDYGEPFTEQVENELLEMLAPRYIRGLSLLGGEPLAPQNAPAVLAFLRKYAKLNKDLWIYSGYTLEDLLKRKGEELETVKEILSYTTVLVDGPFIDEQKSVMLKFRGSANQRLIDVQKTLKNGSVVLFELPE